MVFTYRVWVSGREADLQLAGPLQEPEQDESGALRARSLDDVVERVQPLIGLGRIGVGQLLLELVEDVVHGVPILPADRLMDRCRAPNVASTSG